MNKYIGKFSKFFNEQKWLSKSKWFLGQIGLKMMYTALLLFYAYKRPETPFWAKHIATGAIGYLLTPIDAVPDLTPILGFTDDVGVLSFGLITIACYIDMEVKIAARKKLVSWTGPIDLKHLEEIDRKL